MVTGSEGCIRRPGVGPRDELGHRPARTDVSRTHKRISGQPDRGRFRRTHRRQMAVAPARRSALTPTAMHSSAVNTAPSTTHRQAAESAEEPEQTPEDEAWEQALIDFGRHLTAERGLSTHSVRGYLTDLLALADHAGLMRVDDPADLSISVLRSFLANQKTKGRARSTLARRAASIRSFTAWLEIGRAHV